MRILVFILCSMTLLISPEKVIEEESRWTITYHLNYKTFKSKPSRSKTTTLLFVTKQESFFMDNRLARLLMVNANKNLSADQKRNEILGIGGLADRVIIAKNFETGKIMHAKEYLGQEYYGFESESMKSEVWKILSDTATFFNLKTQKAICDFGGRSWIAWFSSEIPISDGPYKFSGLPGLIIKLESIDNEYSFMLAGIEKNSEIPPLPENKKVSQSKFKELNQYLIDNPFAMMESRGIEIRSHKYNGKIQTREEAITQMKQEAEDLNTIEID